MKLVSRSRSPQARICTHEHGVKKSSQNFRPRNPKRSISLGTKQCNRGYKILVLSFLPSFAGRPSQCTLPVRATSARHGDGPGVPGGLPTPLDSTWFLRSIRNTRTRTSSQCSMERSARPLFGVLSNSAGARDHIHPHASAPQSMLLIRPVGTGPRQAQRHQHIHSRVRCSGPASPLLSPCATRVLGSLRPSASLSVALSCFVWNLADIGIFKMPIWTN